MPCKKSRKKKYKIISIELIDEVNIDHWITAITFNNEKLIFNHDRGTVIVFLQTTNKNENKRVQNKRKYCKCRCISSVNSKIV